MTRHLVQFSGGVGSWAAARRLVDYGEHVELLLAHTNSEASDWPAFVDACVADLGVPLHELNDGRDIWQVFSDRRFLGNTRLDTCSETLKRKPLRRWLEENADPATDVVVLGFDWTEEHRLIRARERWAPWPVVAPLCDPPYTEKPALLAELERRGIPVPELYRQGFPHNNCAGACVKAGQAQWARLLELRRPDYLHAETKEAELRGQLGDVAILRDRRGGRTRPMPLREFRERLEGPDPEFDTDDWGACSCMESTS